MLLKFQKAAVRKNYETGNPAFSIRSRFLTTRDESANVRARATQGLGRQEDHRATTYLKIATCDEESSVSQAAAAPLKAGDLPLESKWPRLGSRRTGLADSMTTLSVENRSNSACRVGVRCPHIDPSPLYARLYPKGFDFVVPANTSRGRSLERGTFDIFFMFSSDLDAVFEGDPVEFSAPVLAKGGFVSQSVTITISSDVAGNYAIKRVR